MLTVQAQTLPEFRGFARRLLAADVPPTAVLWNELEPCLLNAAESFSALPAATAAAINVPRRLADLAKVVACHASPQRFALLYEALWATVRLRQPLLADPSHPLTRQLETMAKQVGRDVHKMHAFVRFRPQQVGNQTVFLAWHRPDHRILTLAAPFFVNRFRHQLWGIATPEESCSWINPALHWGPGLPPPEVTPDPVEQLWRTYYRAIFNPARIKVAMMKREMPTRHWATLPETADIPAMLTEAPARVATMLHDALTSSARSQQRAARIKARHTFKPPRE
ncbi:MAG: TIGR03915 family putative DNA repair protein [Alphaproteobacteria bacterium]|nr:TIGR03915 family putative DNA repair protein [Alphaproteobacteria bacterium]